MAINGVIDSHRRAPPKAIAQLEHLSYAFTVEIVCDGFQPISNMSDISCQNQLHHEDLWFILRLIAINTIIA